MKQNILRKHLEQQSPLQLWPIPRAWRFARIPLCLLFLLVTVSACFSQGKVVFQNNLTFPSPDPTGGGRWVYNLGSPLDPVNGSGLVGTQWVAQLYIGLDAANLTPVTASISKFRNSTTAAKGRWLATTIYGTDNGFLTLPFDYDTPVTLVVKVWDLSKYPTYEEAVAGDGITGASEPFVYHIPVKDDISFTHYYMEGLRAFPLGYPHGCLYQRAKATAELVDGALVGATITDAGCGYTNPPIVLIQGGGGTGATATTVISNGIVVAINIASPGCCYTNTPTIAIASPWVRATVTPAVLAVKVTQHVVLGRRYVLESSYNTIEWTSTGSPFIAESETIQNEFEVGATGGFFRIREAP